MYEILLKFHVNSFYMEGRLELPVKAKSLIIFSQTSGSHLPNSQHQKVAWYLHKAGFGTLQFGLLDEKDIKLQEKRYDVSLLAERLSEVTLWINNHSEYKDYDLGFFGAGTGAAAALKAAAGLGSVIKAVVCREGRTDLIDYDTLSGLNSPTLFVVGELDFHTIKLNQDFIKKLHSPAQLAIIAGASHLFNEEGKIELVAKDSTSWFKKYMRTVLQNSMRVYDLPEESHD